MDIRTAHIGAPGRVVRALLGLAPAVALGGLLWGVAPVGAALGQVGTPPGAPAIRGGSDAPPDGTEPDAPGSGAVVRPVDGAVVAPFDAPETDYGPGHRGTDLAAAPGDEVLAALDGTVTFSGLVAGLGWVTVDHGAGLETTYGVLASRVVTAGQPVAAGQVLGTLGEAADHVDWGARLNGAYIDPLTLLGAWEAHLIDPERLVAPAPFAPPAVGGPAPPAGSGAWTWPAAGRITSGFGYRTHPISGGRKLHAGVDIGAPSGGPIVAAGAGVVSHAGRAGGYGNMVVIDHGGGVSTRYAHCSVLLVHVGQRVERAQLVARVGSTGNSTGPHLHFEYRVGGQARNPLALFGR